MYFLAAKSTKNSPADACAYFVPANVRNGRLFAGLQANRPRFLPLLAGTSFDGSASGRNRSRRNAARSWRNSQIGYAESCQPLEAGFNRRILAWSGTRTTSSPRKRHADGFAPLLPSKAANNRGKDAVHWQFLPPKGANIPHGSANQIVQKNVTRNGTLKSRAQPWKIETTA